MKDVAEIQVLGAKTNNLRSVDCTIPHGKLTVVSGVSGSGKSSLAFDTVYAEGQRRYVETLSTYARQFLQQMQKPPMDSIKNLPPALALKQGNRVNNARSNVGTISELNDHLHLLFCGVGDVHCVGCGEIVTPHTPTSVRAHLEDEAMGERILVCASIRPASQETSEMLLRHLASEGHRRLFDAQASKVVDIDSADVLDLLEREEVVVVLDRLKVSPNQGRLLEAVENAIQLGDGRVDILLWDRKEEGEHQRLRYYPDYRCSSCDTQNFRPVPALFNRQSSVGACDVCNGYGRTVGLDLHKVVPDPRRTLAQGAVACFTTNSTLRFQRKLLAACAEYGIATDRPWHSLSDKVRESIFQGFPGWEGIEGVFTRFEADRYKPHVRIFLARYRGYTHCSTCGGSGLSAAARSVHVGEVNLVQLQRTRLSELRHWLDVLVLSEDHTRAMEALLRELKSRVHYLCEVGVAYLSLNRAARTLSGGEMHRVMLASSVGRKLTDTCYVLDEPTAGLHPRDTERLMAIVERLRDAGNTVVVVEHDPDVIGRAEKLIEIGPAGGERGGEVVFAGDLEDLPQDTATGEMLARRGQLLGCQWSADEERAGTDLSTKLDQARWLELKGACLHNLKDLSVRFAKGRMNVVTGVSGSGKSTLVHHVLHGLLQQSRGTRPELPVEPAELRGDTFDEVVLVGQNALPRSTRSCALTLSEAYTPVRELLSKTQLAEAEGLKPGSFSFNTRGGRCDACEGTGVQQIEMHFIADVELECDVCHGRRFKPEVLDVKWRDHSIADILDSTIDQAIELFSDQRKIHSRLAPLQKVGLGYLRLGQATSKMSGGEMQRVKLAGYLGRSANKHRKERLFIFDEPTVGLHMRDVDRLLSAMRELTSAGHTLIVVEHNMDLIAAADWVVDIGPDAGPLGGELNYAGGLAGLAEADCPTGRHLRAYMEDG